MLEGESGLLVLTVHQSENAQCYISGRTWICVQSPEQYPADPPTLGVQTHAGQDVQLDVASVMSCTTCNMHWIVHKVKRFYIRCLDYLLFQLYPTTNFVGSKLPHE